MTVMPDRSAHPTAFILRVFMVWRGLFALLALVAVLGLWIVPGLGASPWQKIVLSMALCIAALFSLLGLFDIAKRLHRGRTISLILDYLAFVACLVIVLNTGGVFTGIDALADT
ncbi:MAG: hypothetical protein FJZ96_15485, partial [Chloroflexi bacterium]|nr:hypothetical protein [Chloroflexota bacterium]